MPITTSPILHGCFELAREDNNIIYTNSVFH